MTDRGEPVTDQGETIDQKIDTTLAALGKAAVPDGMELRLERLLQQHVTSSAGRQRLVFTSPRSLLMTALCGLALVALTAFVFRPIHPSPSQTIATGMKTGRMPVPVSVAPEDSPAEASPSRSSPARQGAPAHSTALRLVPRCSRCGQAVAPDLNQPPPPLPLTAQEKLLLRFAHRGDPVEMAALDDAQTRSIDFEAQKTQFNDFFYIHPTETLNEDQ